MKKNNGWKRAGCVLLAAQMTVGVLPINSMAAYGNGQGRSGAILEATIHAKAAHTGRSSFRLEKDRMPLLTKHVVNFASDQTTALDASGNSQSNTKTAEDDAKKTDVEGSDPSTELPDGKGGPSTGGDTEKDPPAGSDDGSGEGKPDPETPGVGTGGEEPAAPSTGEGTTTPPADGETTTPPTGEGTTMPPAGGETTTPPTGEGTTTPSTGGETTTPPTGEDPPTGEEQPVLPPDAVGEEEPPSEPSDPEGTETPPPASEEGKPGETEPVAPPEQGEAAPPVMEAVKQPAAMTAAATSDAMASLHIYGYNGWTYNARVQLPEINNGDDPNASQGTDYVYPPYNWEAPPGDDGGLGGGAYTGGMSNEYLIGVTYGESFVGDGVEALSTLQLSRVPDLRFEGWLFAQINPADETTTGTATTTPTDRTIWNTRYWSKSAWLAAGLPEASYREELYKATFDAIAAHGDANLTSMDYGWPFYTTNVVAKWVESSRADLTKLSLYGLPLDKDGAEDRVKLELYDRDFTSTRQKDQRPVDLTTYETDNGSIKDEYYVQVPVQIDRLTMDFTTYEPGTMIRIESDSLAEPILYRYDREGYQWHEPSGSVTVTEEEYDSRNVDSASPLLREQPGRGAANTRQATNSYDDPARANWSLPTAAAIPLELTTPKDVYTDVVITVVAPDGSISEDGKTTSGTTAEYTLHVRRMADPEIKLNPGNTPYGMIREETRSTWDKDDLREYFDTNRAFPTGAVLLDHNGGAIYQGKFSGEAWTETDYDESETALVVYQDATFTDPGFTLTDSQGKTVDSRDLKRSIRLRRVSALTTSCIHEGAGEKVYYQNGSLTSDEGEIVMEHVDTVEGKDQISLKGLNIVPGIYTIEYSYEDPASDRTYNSVDTSVYMDVTRAADFSRTLIVLPKPGDVDMDGMVTLADAIALEELLNDEDSFLNVDSPDGIERLFKYRVCDVDRDGRVTETDVDELKSGYVPRQIEDMRSDYFYLNSGDRGERERKDLTTDPTSTGKAEISVEYLGKTIVGVPSGVVNDAEVERTETFWVGVKLKNANALPNFSTGVKAFEFTFLYDPSILSPGLLLGTTDWKGTVEAANLSGGSTTPWKDAYALVGNSGPGGSLTTYSELAIPSLALPESQLACYTIALELKPGATAHSLSEGYLLYIPFTLQSHPVGVEHDFISLLEPAMGSREFSLVYTDGTVAAWSGQDTVFGGSTQSLKTDLAYTGTAAIPIGEDKTPCITLYADELDDDNHVQNARYGESFYFSGANSSSGSVSLMNPGYQVESGALPPGMRYDAIRGVIETTGPDNLATRAGVYRFYINKVLYQIIVDKAPLTLMAAGGARNHKFYGEPNPNSSIMEFDYDPSQLKQPELDRISENGWRNSGRGSDLEAILADERYKRPTMTPVDGDGAVLTYKAPAGEYTLELTGGLATNYVFRYLRQGETEPNTEKATNIFTVSPRPIVIERIKGPVGKMDSKPKDNNFALDLTARFGSGAGNFVAKFPDNPDYFDENSMSHLSGDPVLSTDNSDLRITYTGEFRRTAQDTKPFEFTLESEEESRPVEITNYQIEGNAASNYRVYSLETNETSGTVVLVPVTELKLEGYSDLVTEYTYGNTLALAGLGTIKLRWKNGAEEDPFPYNAMDNIHGIMLCWVDKEGDMPSATSSMAYDGQPLTVKGQDGKYLCVYVNNGASYDPACDYVGPFRVHKAELTLTVEPQTRYYGEPDAEPRITYSRSDLKGEDVNIYQNGLLQELKNSLAGFRDLEISYRETASANGRIVGQKTDAGDYFVVLSKAVADNYTITYRRPNVTATSREFGYAAMKVLKRPIHVDRVTGTVGFFYDDTSTNIKTVQGTTPAAENQGFAFEITSPTTNYRTDKNPAYEQELGSLTQSAVVAGDTLTITYRATFHSENDRKPFFDTDGWTTDTKTYSVTVDRLQLNTAMGAGRNYELVYRDSEDALNGRPQVDDESQGDVVIRRIERLEIRPLPQYTDYTYGDTLQLDGSLAVRIYYAAENGRSNYEDVIYYQHRVDDVVTGDTFADNGLRLEWSDENGNAVEGAGEAAYHGQLLTVIDHDGKCLVVKGRHHETHEEKIVVANQPITVAKKPLRVRARDITRVYGQENLSSGINANYGAVVDWQTELIPEDWDKLEADGFDMDGTRTPYDPSDDLSIEINQLATAAASTALTHLDPTYVGPEFRTSATSATPVGKYELSMSGGSMANYDFEFKPGAIEITKRRIYLMDIAESKYPLATMVEGSNVGRIPNVMASWSTSQQELGFALAAGSGSAIVNEDEVTASMTVEFGYNENGSRKDLSDLTIPEGQVTERTWVYISNIRLVKGNENYELVDNQMHGKNPVKLGRIDGRQIDRIEFSDPGAIKTQYDYGDSLDLFGLKVNIYYKSAPGESSTPVERNVDVTSRGDLSLHYLADPTVADDPGNWQAIAEGNYGKAAAADFLHIASDEEGFTHQGKYLVVSAKASLNPGDYTKPVVVNTPLNITPRTLRYTLGVDTKPYDGTTQAWGTLLMDMNQIYPGDVVNVYNGDDGRREEEGANYVFYSNPTYGVGFRFVFADENVAYENPTGHDDYGALKAVPAGIQNVTLSGKDAANYRLERTSVPSSDPAAPSAVITRAVRPAPDTASVTNMSTDLHTNTVMVFVDRDAPSYGDTNDDYNEELHYEYKLEYLADETDLTSGFLTVMEEDPDSHFFGGEPVSVTSEDFEAAPEEKDELTPGMGQPTVEGDSGFGSRMPLPRDTYFRALVRLARTHNYEPSEYVASVSDDDMVAAIATARAAEESDDIDSVLSDSEEVEPPRPIAEKQSLGKSYQYRIDVVAAQTMRGTDGKEHVRSQLDGVWFVDRATYPMEDYLNALTTDTEEPRYQSYSWDPEQKRRVNFPLDLEETLVVDMPTGDGATAPEVVCGPETGGTIRLYSSLVPLRSGGSFYAVTILNGDIVAYVGDDPVQLQLRIEPNENLGLYWSSSDTSVVSVDQEGVLTFVGEGTAQIRVAFGTYSDAITVTVLPKPQEAPKSLFNWDFVSGFMAVTEELLFYPEQTMNRGELAVILAKFLHPLAEPPEGEVPVYADMDESMDCFQAVTTMSQFGLLKGVGEGRFAPDQTVTRAEIAAILVRMASLPAAPEDKESFMDSGSENTWAWAEIKALEQAGITRGTGDNCFNPGRNLTRAEAAAFLTRMLHYKLDPAREGLVHPVDVEPEYWAWREIMQAVNGADMPEEPKENR